jgi:hypothetical protein
MHEISRELFELVRAHLIESFGREPDKTVCAFWTTPVLRGQLMGPLGYHAMWRRLGEAGEKAGLKITAEILKRSGLRHGEGRVKL